MKLSVVVPTYNRIQTIPVLLDSLERQTISSFRVIIVNDGSDKDTSIFLHTLPKKHALDINIINQINSGRAASRNAGAFNTQSDLILFLDDDMEVPEDWIEKHIHFHSNTPGCVLVGSGYRNSKQAGSAFEKYIVRTERSWKNLNPGKTYITLRNYIFTACNMSVPRDLFIQLKGFNEHLRDAEDFDFGIRAIQQGIRVFYDPGIIAWHNDWPDIKRFATRHSEYNKGKAELLRRYPEYGKLIPSLQQAGSNKLKAMLLRICKVFFERIGYSKVPLLLPSFLHSLYFRLCLATLLIGENSDKAENIQTKP